MLEAHSLVSALDVGVGSVMSRLRWAVRSPGLWLAIVSS